MNIEISDALLTETIKKEMTKVVTPVYSEKSYLEMAVRKAMQEMATEKVMELLKSDPKYVESLNKLIESNIVASFEAVAKRISQDLGESLVSAIENEFRTYGN